MKTVPRSDLGVRAAPDGQNDERLNVKKSTFYEIWSILEHFWDPSKSSLGPETAQLNASQYLLLRDWYILDQNLAYCCEIDQNIAYCCEMDIFIDQNIAYCCEIDIFMDQNAYLKAKASCRRPPKIIKNAKI